MHLIMHFFLWLILMFNLKLYIMKKVIFVLLAVLFLVAACTPEDLDNGKINTEEVDPSKVKPPTGG